mmetsp:Transcript_18267/g.26225  ORF Transcript_18267/g.26225 Transcript_18267/m.26225 type:complete len:321 (+) Transcript_18267:174-1136(+)|eukprot:CAMPEP_0202458722 /NCGR_PEP_ID=MMETSP1360-20130828/27442_1 /ASSEMBLY_ACC=CAM_ASM_000848 /TAXON_ID=515479 /ORGANISM="Licmophora paradoxa, Strain CCMP2313" /LENGTH=320 /DNA_ID=CAMNT_0049079399 /DNA_START=166 /DNA_END=1128 /DNA_ORIENTATION=+
MLSRLTHKAVKKSTISSQVRSVSAVLWSGDMSFSSPESDFVARKPVGGANVVESTHATPMWTRNLSFSSPESDFVGENSSDEAGKSEWSGILSFASPESDFVAHPDAPEWEWSSQLSYTSPETDFVSNQLNIPQGIPYSDELLSKIQACPLMNMEVSHPESASGAIHAHHFFDTHQIVQLYQSTMNNDAHAPLPSTIQDALATEEPRAIVITEANAPFNIVDVNDAWVGLCGYSKEEARHKSLQLIQGPATDRRVLDGMLAELLDGRETSTTVTNYTKNGRKFLNKLRAGPIRDVHDRITHFVGILEEINEHPTTAQMAM